MNWRSYFPRGVVDPHGPNGEPVPTPTDHRLLWALEGQLAVRANNEGLHELAAALRSYLNENCQHWYRESACCGPPTPTCTPPHRQCMWCKDVQWLDEAVTP